MGEPAGDDDGVDTVTVGIAVPEDLGVAAERADGLDDIELAVGAGEQDDADTGGHHAGSACRER